MIGRTFQRTFPTFFHLNAVLSNLQSARTYLNDRDDSDHMNPKTSYTSLPNPVVDLIHVFNGEVLERVNLTVILTCISFEVHIMTKSSAYNWDQVQPGKPSSQNVYGENSRSSMNSATIIQEYSCMTLYILVWIELFWFLENLKIGMG